MKRLISVICVILSLAMLLCACESGGGKSRADEGKEGIVGTPIVDDLFEDEKEVENVFINESNYVYEPGAINIRPRHMYWEGDTLVAECFVSSGLDTVAYNIKVEGLGFENDDGAIADGAFGVLEGASVAPYTYIIWTFRFSGDAVENIGADLTGGIGSHYDVSYSH